jgi:hypothetical protein
MVIESASLKTEPNNSNVASTTRSPFLTSMGFLCLKIFGFH